MKKFVCENIFMKILAMNNGTRIILYREFVVITDSLTRSSSRKILTTSTLKLIISLWTPTGNPQKSSDAKVQAVSTDKRIKS